MLRFNTNTLPFIMWLLLYIHKDPKLLQELLLEVRRAFDANGELDTNYLISADNCPLLNSVYYETLRLVSGTVSFRQVTETTNVGNYTLHKGVNVMSPSRTLQISEQMWGPTAAQFNPYRFVDRPQDATGNNMRAFGGGIYMCPGK